MPKITQQHTFTGLTSTRGQVGAQRSNRLTDGFKVLNNTPDGPQLQESGPQNPTTEGVRQLTVMPAERRRFRFIRARDAFVPVTWTQVFQTEESSESQSTEASTPPDPEIEARTEAIKSTLADMEPLINALNTLIQLWRENGKYCEFCTPSNRKAGSCGYTCPLLRPKGGGSGMANLVNVDWVKQATKTKGHYSRIKREMRMADNDPTSESVSGWESGVEDLRKALMSPVERQMDKVVATREIKKVKGLDPDWTFEKAWKVKEYEVELAPDELPE